MTEIRKEALGASGIQALKRLRMVIGEIEAASCSVGEAVEVDGAELIGSISQESLGPRVVPISIKVFANDQLDEAIQPESSRVTGASNIIPFESRPIKTAVEIIVNDTKHEVHNNVISMSELVEARKRKLEERKAA